LLFLAAGFFYVRELVQPSRASGFRGTELQPSRTSGFRDNSAFEKRASGFRDNSAFEGLRLQ